MRLDRRDLARGLLPRVLRLSSRAPSTCAHLVETRPALPLDRVVGEVSPGSWVLDKRLIWRPSSRRKIVGTSHQVSALMMLMTVWGSILAMAPLSTQRRPGKCLDELRERAVRKVYCRAIPGAHQHVRKPGDVHTRRRVSAAMRSCPVAAM